ncbi:MAG TPA: hypothetical protein VJ743_00465 [Albitalea sp.]|nr:hypothetical protein [Albitalea sp.]
MTRDWKMAGLGAALALAACSPALNWREVHPEATELVAMFPCKPQQVARTVALAGTPTQMRLVSCTADGATYAVAYASVRTPAEVAAALSQLHQSAVDNIGASAGPPAAFTVAGMTPQPLAQRRALRGRGLDGQAVSEQVAMFAKGLTVYQATMVGPSLDAEAADTFFAGLKLPS